MKQVKGAEKHTETIMKYSYLSTSILIQFIFGSLCLLSAALTKIKKKPVHASVRFSENCEAPTLDPIKETRVYREGAVLFLFPKIRFTTPDVPAIAPKNLYVRVSRFRSIFTGFRTSGATANILLFFSSVILSLYPILCI